LWCLPGSSSIKTPLDSTPIKTPTSTPRNNKNEETEPLEIELEIVEAAPIVPAAAEEPPKAIKPLYWFMYALTTLASAAAVFWVEYKDEQREWHLLTGYAWVCIMLAVGDGTPKQVRSRPIPRYPYPTPLTLCTLNPNPRNPQRHFNFLFIASGFKVHHVCETLTPFSSSPLALAYPYPIPPLPYAVV
jgi:hypothetical protein